MRGFSQRSGGDCNIQKVSGLDCDHIEIEVRGPTSISCNPQVTSSYAESLYSGDGGGASSTLLVAEQVLTQSTAKIRSKRQPKIAGTK